MPHLDLTLIPFIWSAEPDSTIIDIVREIAADPDNHELLRETRTLMPVGSLDVTAHDPVLSSRNNANALLGETSAIRVMESGSGFYMGTMSGRLGGSAGGGLAHLGGRSSVSRFRVVRPWLMNLDTTSSFAMPRAAARTRTRRTRTRMVRSEPGGTTSGMAGR